MVCWAFLPNLHYTYNSSNNDECSIISCWVEPIKYFVPSVGISEITEIPKKITNSNNLQFIVGTMGTAKKIKDGMLSLYFFEYDNSNNKIKILFL